MVESREPKDPRVCLIQYSGRVDDEIQVTMSLRTAQLIIDGHERTVHRFARRLHEHIKASDAKFDANYRRIRNNSPASAGGGE